MMLNFVSSTVFAITIIVLSTIHYSFPNLVALFADFPTHPDIRLLSIDGVENGFDYAVVKGDAIFTAITIGIRSVLDSLEMLFVKTPWIVVIGAIAVMTGLSAGPRAAIYSVAFLAYMGLLGFWIKAMTTLALLGTAAILSITIGIPLGIYCSTRPRFYAFIRPIMDFMQTMPAFVFMIPVIAFFGTGKVAAVIITMMVIVFFLAMVLDPVGIMLITLPVFLPIVQSMGFDPVWFGILFVINMEIGYMTPPFGFNLFYLKGVVPPSITMKDIYVSVIPFVLVEIVGLALIMIFPEIATWLPELLF